MYTETEGARVNTDHESNSVRQLAAPRLPSAFAVSTRVRKATLAERNSISFARRASACARASRNAVRNESLRSFRRAFERAAASRFRRRRASASARDRAFLSEGASLSAASNTAGETDDRASMSSSPPPVLASNGRTEQSGTCSTTAGAVCGEAGSIVPRECCCAGTSAVAEGVGAFPDV